MAFVFSLKPLFSVLMLFLFFHFPPFNLNLSSFSSPLLSQCDTCLDISVAGLMAGLRGC